MDKINVFMKAQKLEPTDCTMYKQTFGNRVAMLPTDNLLISING